MFTPSLATSLFQKYANTLSVALDCITLFETGCSSASSRDGIFQIVQKSFCSNHLPVLDVYILRVTTNTHKHSYRLTVDSMSSISERSWGEIINNSYILVL